MKVVLVYGAFPADLSFTQFLDEHVRLSVFGTSRPPLLPPYDPRAPGALPHRDFRPIGVPGLVRRGNIHWVYPGLGRALRRDPPDIVHVISEPWGLLVHQVLRANAGRGGFATVAHGCDRVWVHGSRAEVSLRRRLATASLRRLAGFASETERGLVWARRWGLADFAPTAVIHTNPRDPQVFRPPDTELQRVEARRQLGLPEQGIGIGFLGKLIREKGIQNLIDGFALDKNAPAGWAWLAIGGTGPLTDSVARQLHTKGQSYLGHLEYPNQTALFLRAIDVLFVPSVHTLADQNPRVVIEGMLSGCLVVGSRSGGIPGMIGEAGIVLPDTSPRSISAVLTQIRAGGALAPRYEARSRAKLQWSGESVAARLTNLWERTLAQEGVTHN